MTKGDTLSLGEFRRQTADLPDDTAILMVSEGVQNNALAVDFYPYENSLTKQGALLLRPDITDSVPFQDW